MNYKIAVVTPIEHSDFLTDTVLHGLSDLKKEHPTLSFFYPDDFPTADPYPFAADKGFLKDVRLPRRELEAFAKTADLVILCYGKGDTTDVALVERIGGWQKTVYIDGSETGKDRWRDADVQMQIIDGTYTGLGAPDLRIAKLAKLYFRREKPYSGSIVPFPFGIETRFSKYVGVKKDIDFACMFGQDGFPKARQYVKILLEKFCKKNRFSRRDNKKGV